MGIDRIGKGGAPPTVPDTQGTGSVDKSGAVERPFSVERPDASRPPQAAAVEGATGSSPLARLRAGEIDVNGYVDLKIDEAMKGLEGLPPSELAEIRKILRDQMATDPGLSDLVRTATGRVPTPPED
jgi:hypothetical protein